jgi:hypothetical protein
MMAARSATATAKIHRGADPLEAEGADRWAGADGVGDAGVRSGCEPSRLVHVKITPFSSVA